jgi:hypothetical protein
VALFELPKGKHMHLTILFDHPYWIGLLEDERDGCLYAARHIFGAEPSDQQVYEFVLREASILFARMTTGIAIESGKKHAVGYKRMIREARRSIEDRGISMQAQAAIRQQIEANKQVRQQTSRAAREAERKRKREIARQKAQEKHRGH